jgi:uncharacterized protein (TIGR03118 family)
MRKLSVFAGLIFAAGIASAASPYSVHTLISDVPDPNNPNIIIEPSIVDPWGIAISASSPFWISNAGTGLATVYSYSATSTCAGATVNPITLPTNPCAYTVSPTTRTTVPNASGGSGRVTGQIAGSGLNFVAHQGDPAPSFLFCTEDGTISVRVAPNNNNAALVTVNNNGKAVYKGCAAAVTPNGSQFFAANFKTGNIDVFDTSWNPVDTGGGFTDPNIPAGMNPFNVWVLGNKVIVTYAMLGPDGVSDVPGRGNGAVAAYDLSGNLIGDIMDPSLNSPWGLAIAPEFFGDFSFTLLVGNFGDGKINAFDILGSGSYVGTLSDSTGKPIVLEGLWGLQFGNGGSGGGAKALYFAAGISGGGKKEAHGLFGAITTP